MLRGLGVRLIIIIMEKFIIRTYTKKELALMYFPEASSAKVAVNHLRAWIYRCKPLYKEMQEAHYVRNSKVFTPRQVRLIIDYLGEP